MPTPNPGRSSGLPDGPDRSGITGPDLSPEQREFAAVLGRLLAERWGEAATQGKGDPSPRDAGQESDQFPAQANT
jgi:hypothetical protein